MKPKFNSFAESGEEPLPQEGVAQYGVIDTLKEAFNVGFEGITAVKKAISKAARGLNIVAYNDSRVSEAFMDIFEANKDNPHLTTRDGFRYLIHFTLIPDVAIRYFEKRSNGAKNNKKIPQETIDIILKRLREAFHLV